MDKDTERAGWTGFALGALAAALAALLLSAVIGLEAPANSQEQPTTCNQQTA